MTSAALTIKDVKARAVRAPLARPITTAVATIPSAPLILIDVETDQGIVGRSYIFGYSPVTLRPLVELIANLAEMLRGKSVSPVERMRDFDNGFRLLGRQGLLGMAISGLDMAFWDALGQAQGLSVARLLGGEDKPALAYDSYGVVDPKRDARDLEKSLGQGFSAIKIKIGGGDLRQDLDTVAAVRDIVGAATHLMVDYNQSLSVPEAVRRIRYLADYDLLWVEEPVLAEDLSGHATVRANSTVSIQTGENWWFPEDAARAIAAKASDFAMLDLMKIGGVNGWLRAAAQAEGASLPVSSHLFVEASAHLLAVTPTAHFLEYLDIGNAILSEPLVIEGGMLRPRGPGFGLAWNEDAVKRYAI
ncbi:MAG: enolase C-terminal domain-like protein [Alphaproteobacteria bacterium]